MSPEQLTAIIKNVTDGWDEPLDEVHDIPPIVNAIIAATSPAVDVQTVRAEAWDEAAHAYSQFWTRMIGWANQSNPRREDAPEQPTNPFSARAAVVEGGQG